MYFDVTHSVIYNWKGSGTKREQKDSSLLDSFCHLVIAREFKTGTSWVLLIDQGDDTGMSTSNCVEYILPRICEDFTLQVSDLRAFEIWPHHTDDPRLKYTEIIISEVTSDNEGDRILRNSWRPANKQDALILEQIIEAVGDKVIREVGM